MYDVESDGTVTELDSAALPSSGLLSQHAIFGVTKHPTEKWLYTSSLNECSNWGDACWGNARIDRFTYNAAGEITYDGLAFNYDTGSGPECADEDWGIPGQVGSCAPTTTAFSSDGSRLYADDDDYDVVQIFSVDGATGDLTFLWESPFGYTFYNGLAVSPSDGYLYNGSAVIELVGDTALAPVGTPVGNATEIVTDTGGDNLLVTTGSNEDLAIYDLTDESAPSLIDEITLADAPVVNFVSGGSARFQASSSDLSTFIVVGAESIATVEFDGATLTLLDQVFDADDTLDVINRGVAITSDGKYALVAWFIPYDEVGDPLLTGGMTVYGIAVDGTLSVMDMMNFAVPSRVALRLP
jgi:hypothetical protein